MKRILLFLIVITVVAPAFAQKKADDKFKGIKILKNEEAEEVQIDIRKPDNASKMARKQTEFMIFQKLEYKIKIKKSNKLLY